MDQRKLSDELAEIIFRASKRDQPDEEEANIEVSGQPSETDEQIFPVSRKDDETVVIIEDKPEKPGISDAQDPTYPAPRPQIDSLPAGSETAFSDVTFEEINLSGQDIDEEKIEKAKAKRERKRQRRLEKEAAKARKKKQKKNQKSPRKEGKHDKQAAKEAKSAARKAEKEKKKARKRQLKEQKRASREEKKEAGGKLKRKLQAHRAKRLRNLRKDIVGFDIGSSHLRACLIKPGKSIKVFEKALPPGIIVNGRVEEREDLSREIREFWKENGLTKKVNFGMKNKGTVMKVYETAATDPKTVRQSVASASRRLFAPLDIEKFIIDFSDLTKEGKRNRLQIGASDERMTRDIRWAVEKAGLFAVNCEIGPLAAHRSMVMPRYRHQAHVVIDFGAETTSVQVCSGPDVLYLRVIEIGGNDFTEIIARESGLSWVRAEQQKKQMNLSEAAVSPKVHAGVDALIHEIEQTIRESENVTGRKIASWSAMGGGADFTGLKERVSVLTGLPSPLTIQPRKETPDPAISEHATVLGLALGHDMSLLPGAEASGFNVLAMPGLRRMSSINLKKTSREGEKAAKSGMKSSLKDPKLVSLMVSAMLLAYMFSEQSKINSETEPFTAQASALQMSLDKSQSQPAPVVYTNSKQASLVANILQSRPGKSSVELAIGAVQRAGGSNISVLPKEGTFSLTASASRDISDAVSEKIMSQDRDGETVKIVGVEFNKKRKKFTLEADGRTHVKPSEDQGTLP